MLDVVLAAYSYQRTSQLLVSLTTEQVERRRVLTLLVADVVLG